MNQKTRKRVQQTPPAALELSTNQFFPAHVTVDFSPPKHDNRRATIILGCSLAAFGAVAWRPGKTRRVNANLVPRTCTCLTHGCCTANRGGSRLKLSSGSIFEPGFSTFPITSRYRHRQRVSSPLPDEGLPRTCSPVRLRDSA